MRATRSIVDLGLALLAQAAKPGVPLTQQDIGAWCGCSKERVYKMEKDAMKKVRNRFLFGSCRTITQELLANK